MTDTTLPEAGSATGSREPTETADAASVARLTVLLLEPDCAPGLWASVDSGEMDHLVPEFPLLRMEQDPIHRHKDVLSHTIAVVAKVRLHSATPSPPAVSPLGYTELQRGLRGNPPL